MKLFLTIIVIALTLTVNDGKASANTLTVTPNYDGTVMMVADDGVDGVARINLTFSYSTTFSEPRIVLQGGDYSPEQMGLNSRPGLLKLDIIRDGDEMREAAFVFISDFDVKPESQPCAVDFVAATYTYANGKTASPRVIILPAPQPPKKPEALPDEGSAQTKSQPAIATSTPERYVSTDGNQGRNISKPATASTRKGEARPDLSKPLEYRACPDILQRFRDYQGDRSIGNLVSLFNYDNPCGCEQIPRVAISDGASKVVVSIEVESTLPNSPSLGLSGARILSTWRDSERKWKIELLPNQGEHEVVLYVIAGSVLQRIPLIVAPPLGLYMKGLSSEEKRSPLFEFTIAANYLAAHKDTTANAQLR